MHYLSYATTYFHADFNGRFFLLPYLWWSELIFIFDGFSSSRMRHVAAYLLLALGGNNNISAKDVTDLLSSVGVEPNPQSLKVDFCDQQ